LPTRTVLLGRFWVGCGSLSLRGNHSISNWCSCQHKLRHFFKKPPVDTPTSTQTPETCCAVPGTAQQLQHTVPIPPYPNMLRGAWHRATTRPHPDPYEHILGRTLRNAGVENSCRGDLWLKLCGFSGCCHVEALQGATQRDAFFVEPQSSVEVSGPDIGSTCLGGGARVSLRSSPCDRLSYEGPADPVPSDCSDTISSPM